MKVYIVWVYDWPCEMVIINDIAPREEEHSRQRLVYKYRNFADTKTVYFRLVKEIEL